jgi:tRNA(Leu) C34 or U34 (ribose-2'-O)-methylase TrmL
LEGELPPPQALKNITGRIGRTAHNLNDMLLMVAPFWLFHKLRTKTLRQAGHGRPR